MFNKIIIITIMIFTLADGDDRIRISHIRLEIEIDRAIMTVTWVGR